MMMMKPSRACPVCSCGSRKFDRVPGPTVRVRCRSCGRVVDI